MSLRTLGWAGVPNSADQPGHHHRARGWQPGRSRPVGHTYEWTRKGLTSERAGGAEKVTVSYPSVSLTRATDSKNNVTDYNFRPINGRQFITGITGSGCVSCGGRDLLAKSAYR